ncbi:MAG: PQQ-dependent sugar dehydrogenase [Deltaproteobacteria bacterium]|nr:PQQ-dependent sugar dehydrogenase [Deltaproteobacteria bacterium]
MKRFTGIALAAFMAAGIQGCYNLRGSSGGGQTEFQRPRIVNSADIALHEGYKIEVVATGLTFPSGIAFDGKGRAFVVESGYSYGEMWTTPRLLRLEDGRGVAVITEGGKNGPWTGAAFHNGNFYVAEGGALEGGRILRISPEGHTTVLVDNLPSRGDYHTNGPVIGPDGMLYFGQGAATNSAVVGEDNFKSGWARRFPGLHDTPCQDITLTGVNYESKDFSKPDSKETVSTGAYSPFGTSTKPGQAVKGGVPCNGAVMRLPIDGGKPELVAWGFRDPSGLAFSPEGRLYVADNRYDERGSRPVFGAADLLWEVKPGSWYGWPDFNGNSPLNEHDHYKPPGKERPSLLLSKEPAAPPEPAAIFPVHSSPGGFDFSRSEEFGFEGEAFVAEFGDGAPDTGKVLAPVGFKVVRVNIKSGNTEEFAANKGEMNGPASWLKKGGLERPVAARFNPDGTALYVVDFGVILHDREGPKPVTGTGAVWRITKKNSDK